MVYKSLKYLFRTCLTIIMFNTILWWYIFSTPRCKLEYLVLINIIILTATWINLRRIAKYYLREVLFIFIVCIPARCILHVNYVLSYLKISVRCNINTLKSTKVSDVSTYTQVCWILVMNKPHTCLHKYTSHYLLYIVFIVADASVGRDCINLHEFHSNFLSVSKYVIYTNCNIVLTLYSCQFMRIKSLSLLLSCMSALSYVFSYFLQVGLIYLVRPII